ncbi:MAG: transposase [Armatimonadetes bacterium]|nr:transposase [Armatimonadota bacterium]
MSMTDRMPRGWHSRRYLPHFNGGEILQMVTFREEDSLPRHLVDYWRRRLEDNRTDEEMAAYLESVESCLDYSDKPSFLARPDIAAIVQHALLHFDGLRYRLLAWVVMSNHAHVILQPLDPHDLTDILQSWKGWSAREANRVLCRKGRFWSVDYFDQFIRDEEHLARSIEYIERNPVKVGLCDSPEEWQWSSAKARAGKPALH